MGGSIAPSQLRATFTASAPPAKTACRLVSGGHRYLRRASGTPAYSPFSIVTPTSPFVGTLSTGPVHGQLVFDPSCAGEVVISSAATFGAPRLHRCIGRESLSVQTATQEWGFEKVFQRRLAAEFVFTGPNPASTAVASEAHAVIATVPGYDLPRAQHALRGATAVVFAAGNPFMAGSATFASTTAPRVSAGHTCTAGGKTFHFSSFRYAGELTPNTNPLTANVDTGALALSARRATLTIRRYREDRRGRPARRRSCAGIVDLRPVLPTEGASR
jgi:hypothetical protein